MKYKVKGGEYGEGYCAGDIIEMDEIAAAVRVALGELEEIKDAKKVGKIK